MQSAGLRSGKAWLAVALFATALGGNPAHAGERTLNVSAVILTQIACGVASENSRPKPSCNASDPRTTYRVRSDLELHASGSTPPGVGAHPGSLVLTIEP